MEIANNDDDHDERKRHVSNIERKELALSCMLNTEVGAILALLRHTHEPNIHISPSEDSAIVNSLKSLRALVFNPQQKWNTVDPSIYLSPFLDVVQGDDIPAPATGAAISVIVKILKLNAFDEKTPGAKDAINSVVGAIINCRLERTDSTTEEAILMRLLLVVSAIMNSRSSYLLTDEGVCTLLNTSFQIVQQSSVSGDLLQSGARFVMQEVIQAIFSRLLDIEARDGEYSEYGMEDSGYGVDCAVDIFHFLCSLLNVVNVVDMEGSTVHISDEDVQMFALVLINSSTVVAGNGIGKHPKLLTIVQDDLFHQMIHYGMNSSPLVLSMICSTVLNVYNSLRRKVRLQLEAFFTFVLFRIAASGSSIQLQEIAVEGIINFCRQPTFAMEAYINYDCDPTCQNVFEEIGNLLCRHAFPTGNPFTSLQIQAFEGLVSIIHSIADKIDDKEYKSSVPSRLPHLAEIAEHKPLWEEKSKEEFEDLGTWVDFVRLRKSQKHKMVIAGNHFNCDEKKGLEYLNISNLVSDPVDPRSVAFFFRYTPQLDKNRIGDYFGEPDEFHIRVLKQFTATFNFSGMILDNALRTYLESFRLPGESQKIDRILEPFAEKFYEQQPTEIFVSKDAVFILCYSLIMLNTDQHNPQVKKKMTEEEFIKNNRGINGGNDLPREYLSKLFQSISNKAIRVFSCSTSPMEMNLNRWIEIMNQSKVTHPYIICDFDCRIGRDMFATIAGPSVSTLCAIFEQADDDDMLHECIEGLFSVARIAQYGLSDTLDEVVASFCKFTTLLNPYVTSEETLFVFTNETKPRMAILAVFTLANHFENSIRGGWRNILDCLLKLKRLKLLPQSAISVEPPSHARSESGFSSHNLNFGIENQNSGLMSRFSQFFSQDSIDDSLALGGGELERNLKIIQQCQIRNIFANTYNLPDEPLLNIGRSLIFAAAGKGQKFSTPVEEEDTVGFCWDLLTIISIANTHRFTSFWPSYHEYLLVVAQFPMFSPTPFAEKAIVGMFNVCLKLLMSSQPERFAEELIFKSIHLMWKFEKEVLDTCCDFIMRTVGKILTECPANLQSPLGWKTILHLISITGRHPETYENAVDTLITLMSDGSHISKSNYTYFIECAFGFVALKNSPLEKNMKILDLMSESVNLLIHWYQSGNSDPGVTNLSMVSNISSYSMDDSRGFGIPNFTASLFSKLGESLRKTSLARREEIRNHAIVALKRCFILGENLSLSSISCINCFNLVIFAMVDDLQEKMLEYSRRKNSEKEMRSMEGTVKKAMELLTDVFLQFLGPISENPGFRTFWLGVLRRMDTCMKADLGEYGESRLQELVADWLRKMITSMKDKGILVQKDGDDLWEITYIQIQWIAPSLKEDLFPDELY